jgi:uncharacterized protein YaaN involved in tellurite resistance
MKTRKVPSEFSTKSNRRRDSMHDLVLDALQQLQQKVLASPALNGGFDTLLFKVEKIEEGQVQMGTKVDSIHEAIYHPDEGLFARVKVVEPLKEKAEAIDQLEKDVLVLQQRVQVDERTVEKEARLTEEHKKLVKLHAEQIKDLVAFKSKVCAIVKWGLVTLGGSVVTLIGKLIYDFVSGHITVH